MVSTLVSLVCGSIRITITPIWNLLPRFPNTGEGFGAVILMEAMKRTQAFGATYCIGGSREFYEAIGFERRGTDSGWYKTCQILYSGGLGS